MALFAVINTSTHLEPTTGVLLWRITFSIKRYSPAGKVDTATQKNTRQKNSTPGASTSHSCLVVG